MTSTVLPVDRSWATRADLLEERAAAMPFLERSVLSGRRLALDTGLLLVAVLALCTAGSAAEEGGATGAVTAAVLAIAGLAAAAPTCRRALRTRIAVQELIAWDAAERAGRTLPTGTLQAALRTPWDARSDADFEDVAGVASAAAYTRPWRNGLLARGALAGMAMALGSIVVLVALASADVSTPFRVGVLVGGGYALACGLVMAVSATRLAYRWTRTSSALDTDIAQVRAERAPAGA